MNWKTTVSGLVASAGAFVAFSAGPPFNVHYPAVVTALAAFLLAGGLASLGINGKDNNTTGGTPTHPATKA